MGKLKIFAILICIAFKFAANAQSPTVELLEAIGRSVYMNELRATSLAVDSILIVRDDHLTSTNTLMEEVGHTFFIRDFIIFEIVINDSTRIQSPFEAQIELNLTFLDSLGDTLNTIISLELEYDTLENNQRLKAIYEFESGFLISSQILSIDATYDWVIHSLRLRNEIHTSRIMEQDCLDPILDLTSTDDFVDHQELIINWQAIDGVKYDLEWTFIDKYSPDYTSYLGSTPEQRESLFKNNSTRVTLDQNSYVIKLGYPEGYLLYRVRAIQLHGPYIILHGPWTDDEVNYYSCDGLEIDKNWTLQASFAEEGKRSTLINYFDGIGRNRQINSINESQQSALISNNYYNIDGLHVFSSLPAPYKLPGENGRELLYFPNFNKDINNQEYNYLDISTDVCAIGSNPMSPSSGAGRYYSSQSDFQDDFHRFTPDAEGFPFSESIYTNDNTGRIAIKGNTGDELSIGGGHETKYFYAKASQEELYRIFGLDVGNEKFYNKEGVIDPNGQFSVTYKDGNDRIIATALGGVAPTSLVSLDYPDEQQQNLTVSLIRSEVSANNQVLTSNSIKLTYFFLVSAPGIYEFDYDIIENPTAILEDCNNANLCYHCKYDLKIELRDECNLLHSENELNYNLNSWNANCGQTYPNITTSFTYNFQEAGAYSITKTLTLNDNMRENYLQDYLAKASCKTYNEFLLEAIAAISFDDCEMTCTECLSNLGSETSFLEDARQDFIEEGGSTDPDVWLQSHEYDIAVALYQELKSKCDYLCDELSDKMCDQFYDQMIVDVSPGGQYFLYDDDIVNNVQSCPAIPLPLFSVLCTNNSNQPAPYATLVYKDELNNDILVETDGGIMKKPNELSLSEFIQNFQPEWADILVAKHPEYCLLEYCGKLKKTMKFDDDLSQINSYQDAVDANIIDASCNFEDLKTPAPVVFKDPIFTIGNANTDFYNSNNVMNIFRVAVKDKLDFYNQSYSALEYAMFLAKDQINHSTNEIIIPSTPNVFSSLCEGEKNYVWNFLKTVYLEQKLEEYTNRYPGSCRLLSPSIGCAVDGYYQNGFTSGGSACSSPGLYGNGIPRFLIVKPFPINSNPTTAASTVATQSAAISQDVCESYRILWETTLQNECTGYGSHPDLVAILDEFEKICKSAVDPLHTIGASNNPNTIAPPLQYQSFQDVLNAFPIVSPPTPICNSLVFSMPPAYNQVATVSPFAYMNNDFISIPECVCEALTDIVIPEFMLVIDPNGLIQYSAALKDDLAEYMKRKYDSELTGDEIQNLSDVCGNSNCKLLSNPIYLPDVLSCKTCINCVDVRAAINAFETDPSLTGLNNSANKNSYLATYLNREFGFNYFWQDYEDFLTTCESCAPPDDCTKALQFYNAWVNNLSNEKYYPLAVYLNINVGTHRTQTEWLQYFDESCNEMNISNELAFQPTNPLYCYILEATIINYISHKDIPNVANFYPDLKQYLFNQFWHYQPSFYSEFDACDFENKLKFHNPDLCNSFLSMAILINSAQPPVIYASDSLAVAVYFNIFPDRTLTYSKNVLRFCGLYNPLVSCNDINTLYNDWLATDLDEPIPFFEFANTQRTWNYPEKSYSNWLRFCNSNQQCKLCYKELMEVELEEDDDCYDLLMSFAAANAQNAWENYLLALEETFNSLYISKCIDEVKEQFDMTFSPLEYHYTLYYYDRAGNLFKTIPPQGVKFLDNTTVQDLIQNGSLTTNPFPYPEHEFVTWYKYNAFNKVIQQRTPDAGETTFWYDEVGRIVLSQSQEKSKVISVNGTDYNYYSYTLYDNLGRIKEVGKMRLALSLAPTCIANQCTYVFLENLINASTTLKTEIVRTFYDEQLVTSLEQENLLKRVASTTYADEYFTDPLIYNYATHYSYDLSGNVKTVFQENTNSVPGQTIKQIDYVFDLISGKVNKVYYQHSTPQETKPDQFVHAYEYDADNKLKKVSTSVNDDMFDIDANYTYYLHGPLARTLLGDRKVQGLDYAYTIQGWLKGVNSSARLAWKDMGRDGWIPQVSQIENLNSDVGRDAISFTLNYFEDDYLPVGGIGWHPELNYSPNDWVSNFSGSLYNGNIRSMTNDIQDIDISILGTAYKYDQLNRIKGTHTISQPNLTDWNWDVNAVESGAYEENGIQYDKNGNIKNYVRKDKNGSIMDDLEYFLDPNEINNRLNYVSDNIATLFDGDIEPQNQDNYIYDDDGNLTTDVQENIDIFWNNFGKVDSIQEKNGRWALGFSYDAGGNRIEKRYHQTGLAIDLFTYYIRDAQGNVMATYKREITSTGEKYSLLDWSVYGSSRLGLAQVSNNILWTSGSFDPPTWTAPSQTEKGSSRSYELTNHLGNVLAVVSDLKTFVDTIGSGQPNYWDYSIANIKAAQDYYPFGMLMPGRTINTDEYRFGFNGQERTDEISGTGNHNTALFWEYDTRLGRRWNLDPKSQINISDYATFANNPIWFSDILGDTWKNKQDKETADKTKSDVNAKISKVDNQLGKLEKAKVNADEHTLATINRQVETLNVDKQSLNNIIDGLDKMENDQEYTFTFSPFPSTPGSDEGLRKLDGEKVGGLTTYSVVDGVNFEGKNYSAIIKLNYNSFTKTGDMTVDAANSNLSKAFKAHEIIHGMQIAMRKMLIPLEVERRNGERYNRDHPQFNPEEDAYQTQEAYEKY